MAQLPSLDTAKTGQAANLIFLPPRFYKPRTEWTEEDWKEDRTAHDRHRRNMEAYRASNKGCCRIIKKQHSISEIQENNNFREIAWAWIVFIGLCILALVLLLKLAHLDPISLPEAPYEAPYIGQNIPAVIDSPIQ
jgi:hypothetical protein